MDRQQKNTDRPQRMVRPVCHVNLLKGCSFRHYSFASRPFGRFANRMKLQSHVKAPLRKCYQVECMITHISPFVKCKFTISQSFSRVFYLFSRAAVRYLVSYCSVCRMMLDDITSRQAIHYEVIDGKKTFSVIGQNFSIVFYAAIFVSADLLRFASVLV